MKKLNPKLCDACPEQFCSNYKHPKCTYMHHRLTSYVFSLLLSSFRMVVNFKLQRRVFGDRPLSSVGGRFLLASPTRPQSKNSFQQLPKFIKVALPTARCPSASYNISQCSHCHSPDIPLSSSRIVRLFCFSIGTLWLLAL